LGVSIVWKAIKCRTMSEVPREAAHILMWIFIGFVAAGAALAGLVKMMER
jgi:hypothetical protein